MASDHEIQPGQVRIAGSPNRALWGSTIGFFIGFGAVSLFGPTAQNFIDAMSLSPAQTGILLGIPMLTGSLLRIPFGAWVDSNGGKWPFILLLVLSVLGIAGLWWMLISLYPDNLDQTYYPLLLFFGALGGCGIATFSVGTGQVSYWFDAKRQGWALAAYAGLGNTSPGLVMIILPLIIMVGGLWSAYMISIAIVLAGLILYFFLGQNAPFFQYHRAGLSRQQAYQAARDAGQEFFPQDNAFKALLDAATEWRTWPLVLIYFTTFGGFLALTAWLPTYWSNYHDAGYWTGILLTATFSLLTSLIRVPGGSWSDKLGGERIAVIALLVLLVGALVMTFFGQFASAVVGVLLIAAGMGVCNAAVFAMLPRYVPKALGGASGLVGGLGALSGSVVPTLMGNFVSWFDKAGYAWGFVIYVALAVFSLVLTGILITTLNRQQAA